MQATKKIYRKFMDCLMGNQGSILNSMTLTYPGKSLKLRFQWVVHSEHRNMNGVQQHGFSLLRFFNELYETLSFSFLSVKWKGQYFLSNIVVRMPDLHVYICELWTFICTDLMVMSEVCTCIKSLYSFSYGSNLTTSAASMLFISGLAKHLYTARIIYSCIMFCS